MISIFTCDLYVKQRSRGLKHGMKLIRLIILKKTLFCFLSQFPIHIDMYNGGAKVGGSWE